MWFDMKDMVAMGPVGAVAGWLIWRTRLNGQEFRRQAKLAGQMQAYAALDVRPGIEGGVADMAQRVCRAISMYSAFRRTAMLVRDPEGRLTIAASSGMDEAAVESVEAWAGVITARERSWGGSVRRGGDPLGVPVGPGSVAVVLGVMPAEMGYTQAVVVPMWTTGGRMTGALVVGADGVLEVRRTVLREALASLEALAVKVERSLENAALAERLLRAEKLAGLGLLAGGMAHALNNPLTAVLGFAELIAGTTGEQRVREDAGIIVQEALRMRQSVESLLEFWRPVETQKRIVDLGELVREVAAGCVEELEERGVRLEVDGQTEPLLIAGNRHRLRQLLEHLLNNAAQAVGREKIAGQMQTIWLAVNGGGETVQMTVSDTGRGFQEPSRIFDPFGGEVGTGMGLSVCYGIAHEHGGEIRATNLVPHGAMVTVELPRERAAQEPKLTAETVALA